MSISKDIPPCLTGHGIPRTECANKCYSPDACGGNCAYFEYHPEAMVCNLYAERPSTVDRQSLVQRVSFPP